MSSVRGLRRAVAIAGEIDGGAIRPEQGHDRAALAHQVADPCQEVGAHGGMEALRVRAADGKQAEAHFTTERNQCRRADLDSAGAEQEIPIDDWIDIAVYGEKDDGARGGTALFEGVTVLFLAQLAGRRGVRRRARWPVRCRWRRR